jgi:spore coat polysaccharide biosynthesis protein SpsF (cytidylyltransferase family)
MNLNYKNRATLAEHITPYLKNISQTWVQCSYCGRTVMYSQRTRHTRIFHTNASGYLIVDGV